MVFAIKSIARTQFAVLGTVNGVSTIAQVRASSVREAITLIVKEEPSFKAVAAKPSYPVL